MSPARPGAFAANFDPETLDSFRNYCKECGFQYSKILETLAELYVETKGKCMLYMQTEEMVVEDMEEIKRLAALLDAAGIAYKDGQTADDYRRQQFEEKTDLLLQEIETLKNRVSKLEEKRQE